MRLKSAVLATACLAMGLAPATVFAKAKPPTPTYYLALGDSLAVGVQPNAAGKSVETAKGYSDVLYAAEKVASKGLKLVKYGCPGESSTTMLKGGKHCGARPYKGAQLAAAIKFIKHHKVALITLDIGANDVDGCVHSDGTLDGPCLTAGQASIKANVPMIVKQLRSAAGPKTKIAGMTYYDPFLAQYFGSASMKFVAAGSVQIAKNINDGLASDFKAQNVKVADVATAFDTYTPFTSTTKLKGHGTVPVAVARICQLTWNCTPKPRGPNIHANVDGYKKIAATFLAKL